MNGLSIVGTGRCVPSKVVTNDDWSQIVDTSDEWIVSRTGIRKRHFCETETNIDLAAEAARQAIEESGIAKEELALCMVGTFTPTHATPSVACMLQKKLALPEDVACVDINAACSGFVYGLALAHGYLQCSSKPYALVIGSEVISKVIDESDRNTCVLFGDGAGAAVVKRSASCFVSVLGARGDDESLYCHQTAYDGKVHMDGKAIFRFAVQTVPECVRQVLQKSGKSMDEIDYIVCHQANLRIVRSAADRLGLPMEKFYVNVQNYGNTSAASIPMALDEMWRDGLLKQGTKIICVGFGAGLTWGGAYLEF